MDQVIAAVGDRSGGALLYDGLDSFFHEGGYKAYISTGLAAATDAAIVALFEANFQRGLGIGQLAAPGLTTLAVQTGLLEAALDLGRVAIVDGLDTPTVASLTGQAAALTGLPGDKFAALFAPWDVIPGVVSGADRTAPPSGRICGNIARNDSRGLSAGDPAAGPNGIAAWATDLSQAFADSDRQTLNEASVNVSILVRNTPRTMGWRSLASQASDSNWSMFNGSRVAMLVLYDLGLVADNFEFSKLDSREHTLKKYAGSLQGALLPFFENDDFYGESSDEAFSVDVGPAVNTPDTIAAGELHARVAFRAAPFGERVIIDVSKVPITESLGAAVSP
jgi:phage tail sheath protein FI